MACPGATVVPALSLVIEELARSMNFEGRVEKHSNVLVGEVRVWK